MHKLQYFRHIGVDHGPRVAIIVAALTVKFQDFDVARIMREAINGDGVMTGWIVAWTCLNDIAR
jgi:hypothetical protein